MTYCRQVFIDTETTGLSPRLGDRIIEFAAVEAIGQEMTGRILHSHFDPQRSINPGATRVHGFTQEMLRGKPLFQSLASEILEFIEGAEVIMHNAPFDTSFLDTEFRRAGLRTTLSDVSKITCTMRLARTLYPGESVSLDALAERARLKVQRKKHSALEDAELLSRIYFSVLNPREASARHAASGLQTTAPHFSDRSALEKPPAIVEPAHLGMEKAVELIAALQETFYYRAKHKRVISHRVVNPSRWEKAPGPLLYAVTDHAGIIRYIGKWVSPTALYSRWMRHNTIHHQESARNLYIDELDAGRGPLGVWSISIAELRHRLPMAIQDRPGKQLAEELEAFLIRHARSQLRWNKKEEFLPSDFPSSDVAAILGSVNGLRSG